MTRNEYIVDRLIKLLLEAEPGHSYYGTGKSSFYDKNRSVLRGLMNLHSPDIALSDEFYVLQDELLAYERDEKGIVDVFSFPSTNYPKIAHYHGDITRLNADAIVNAANSELLGCFVPGHHCIDNVIHSAAGLQLRDECYAIMRAQGHDEPVGSAKITQGYNLPCKYVIHTVGPRVDVRPTEKNKKDLESCYVQCLSLAEKNKCRAIVFPCISTGVFRYPHKEAAEIAVNTVDFYQAEHPNAPIVIFNTFDDIDRDIYDELLEDY